MKDKNNTIYKRKW